MSKIDFHSHILPHVDHGCKSREVMCGQLALAKQNGIDTIVSTSHFYPDRDVLEEFLAKRQVGLEAAVREAEQQGITIIPGAEVQWCKHIERMEGIEQLFIKDKCILLEMPHGDFEVEQVMDTMSEFHHRGIETVLAHVERYPLQKILEFEDEYIHYQINAYSFGKLMLKKKIKQYLNTGKVAALGSDIHGTEDTYKHFTKLEAKHAELFAEIMEKSSLIIIGE